ncbi:MAG: hypothetical protein CMLOHMNK_02053 [Steroidobacteraceae bacterium]|nr:hypothetical protein [Steroidobacteraceae bacterium]
MTGLRAAELKTESLARLRGARADCRRILAMELTEDRREAVWHRTLTVAAGRVPAALLDSETFNADQIEVVTRLAQRLDALEDYLRIKLPGGDE